MDFSELIEAINNGDQEKISSLFEEIRKYLERYLMFEMGADHSNAEEYSQVACIQVFEAIKEGKIENPKKLKTYLISTCRNAYLKTKTRNKEHPDYNLDNKFSSSPQQIEALVEEEKMELLRNCMNKLPEKEKAFIDYVFQNIESETDHLAQRFNITHNNVWVKKHRIINKLKECVNGLNNNENL